MLIVCLISKRCTSQLSFSKDYFMEKCCFLSLNLVFCVIQCFTLDLGRNGSKGKNSEAGKHAWYMLVVLSM